MKFSPKGRLRAFSLPRNVEICFSLCSNILMILSSRTTLFRGIENEREMIQTLDGKMATYRENEAIIHKGNYVSHIGLVLSGSVSVIRYDMEGNGDLISIVKTGEIFAESFAICSKPSPVTIQAREDSCILWLPIENIRKDRRLLENLLLVSAERNLFLTKRLEHLGKRTLKDKVLSYLEDMRETSMSDEFDIPLDRQEMADYLSSDRSALSLVLSKLKNEGVIDFRKNHFILHYKMHKE